MSDSLTQNALAFTPAEVSANYPAFFERYPILPENTAIGKIFKHNFEVDKRDLRSFFGFDRSGRLLLAKYEDLDSTVESAFPNCHWMLMWFFDYFVGCGHGTAKRNIVDNCVKKGGQKLSRAVLDKYNDAKNRTFKGNIDGRLLAVDMCLELPRLPLAKRHDFSCVLQNFYSELAQVKKMEVSMYLSVNPYDIANASNNAKFSSCNALGGMHENAPICAAASPAMAMLRLEDQTGQLLGRCWVAFSPDYKSFVVQPTYGYMKDDFVEDAKQWLCLYIDKKIGSTDLTPWKVYSGPTNINPRYVSDCDTNTTNFYVDGASSILFRADYKEIPAVRVGGGHCLICGKDTQQLVCSDCKKSHFGKCKFCGKPTLKEDEMCPTCAKAIKQCDKCGKTFFPDNSEHTVCNACAYTRTVCVVCGETIALDSRQPFPDRVLTWIVEGSLVVHTCCVNGDAQKHRCRCGLGKSPYSNYCKVCDAVRSSHRIAEDALGSIKNLRKKLALSNPTVNLTKVNPRLVIPQEITYAMAA